MSHPGIPRARAGHFRHVVGNDDTIETVRSEDLEDTKHICIPLINENLVIIGNLSVNIAQVNVTDLALYAIAFGGLVNVHSITYHLRECADTKLKRIAWAWHQIKQTLILFGPIYQASRLS